MLLNNTAPFNPQAALPAPPPSWSKEAIIALVALLLMVLVPCFVYAYRAGILREAWRIVVGPFRSDDVQATDIRLGLVPSITPEELSQAERNSWLELSVIGGRNSHGTVEDEWNYTENIV